MGPSTSPTDDEPSSRLVPRVRLGTWPPLSMPVYSRNAVEKAALFARQSSVAMRERRMPCPESQHPGHQVCTMRGAQGQNERRGASEKIQGWTT
jgi:hypothetical protein